MVASGTRTPLHYGPHSLVEASAVATNEATHGHSGAAGVLSPTNAQLEMALAEQPVQAANAWTEKPHSRPQRQQGAEPNGAQQPRQLLPREEGGGGGGRIGKRECGTGGEPQNATGAQLYAHRAYPSSHASADSEKPTNRELARQPVYTPTTHREQTPHRRVS